MKKIKLTQGKFALVNDEDFEWLNQYKWCVDIRKTQQYAVTRIGKNQVYMHRLIMGLEKNDNKTIDHQNRNGLNNMRHNLRIATRSQNARNKKVKGYHLAKRTNKYGNIYFYWQSTIKINGKTTHLGYFKTKKEAARAYQKALRNVA